jgi:hypothetical protein
MDNPFDEKYYGDDNREAVKVSRKAQEIEKEDYFETVDPKQARKYELKSSQSLTLGILSIVTCTFWYLFIPAGVMAIVFGHRGYSESGRKTAKAGFILGIIGLALGLIIHLPIIGLFLGYNF